MADQTTMANYTTMADQTTMTEQAKIAPGEYLLSVRLSNPVSTALVQTRVFALNDTCYTPRITEIYPDGDRKWSSPTSAGRRGAALSRFDGLHLHSEASCRPAPVDTGAVQPLSAGPAE
ncbi:hypothetical protein HAZT_HAZT001391 [Hyalella azteca]|uniref:Uncharacterized protein n=1 Tax=Hyalella azteca TaxID=294128 RepID=A0A6A0H552_HYAAZ|nr:hypothetical protein HAZT_HAZT001391 [Hyalella azteca]